MFRVIIPIRNFQVMHGLIKGFMHGKKELPVASPETFRHMVGESIFKENDQFFPERSHHRCHLRVPVEVAERNTEQR